MRYIAVLLLSSTLLACTTTQGTGQSGQRVKTITAEALPDNDRLTYQMGVQYIERAEYTVAEEKLLTLVPKYPNFTELFVMLGVVQERQGKRTDALNFYSKAIATNPTDRMAIKHYARLQCNQYDKNAPSHLAQIADNAMSEVKAGMSSGAAACYLVHKDPVNANLYADKAIAANPHYGDSYFFKAMAAKDLKRYQEVFPALDRYHDEYGYEPASVYLGLEAAKQAHNKAETEKYESVLARYQS
ncbi:tetratricopeptide repeat protein [Wohlfahrtiimonas chitiniclastica]|uniref:tetratricopeptide repeat protein n=1 Tax=Wohlfahrtiimonas chitiniclastica TaxID=400946 RepID=UPI001BCE202A|nr:hypothetical protein [Wohlfahrtiimonas chitiniclastica]MBS7838301.1 hypothetical protein [Wohlfahrtiimonas chitiniclastica]